MRFTITLPPGRGKTVLYDGKKALLCGLFLWPGSSGGTVSYTHLLAEGQLAYQNLAKMGMAFLVVRANLQIERLPRTGEKVKVCTCLLYTSNKAG